MSTFARDDGAEAARVVEELRQAGLGTLRVVDAVEAVHEFPESGGAGPTRRRKVEVLGLVDLEDAKLSPVQRVARVSPAVRKIVR